jgi:predicted MFS family arabinose efflux permease
MSAGPLAAALIEAFGWREAYALLGGGSGLLALLAALTVRLPRAAEVGHVRRAPAPTTDGSPGAVPGMTLRSALADRRHWCMNVAWFLLGGLALMVSVHAVPYARDQGIGLAAASLALTAYGLGAVTGRLTAGAVSDRVGAQTTLRIGFVLQVVSLSALLWVPSREVLMVALALFGAGFAASDTMITRLVPDVFGLRAIGAIMGLLTLGWRCGAALGPAVAGFVYDATGSYRMPFGVAPVAVVVSWILVNLATRAGR